MHMPAMVLLITKIEIKFWPTASQIGGLENAAPGLIIRKTKQVKGSNIQGSEQVKTSSSGAEMAAEDAIALLLKHKRGYYDLDEEAMLNGEGSSNQDEPGQDNKKPRRVLSPEKPSFLQKILILNRGHLLKEVYLCQVTASVGYEQCLIGAYSLLIPDACFLRCPQVFKTSEDEGS
ncbi:hypothetical protein AKJ16_DCAP08535 [Drosera capensis]